MMVEMCGVPIWYQVLRIVVNLLIIAAFIYIIVLTHKAGNR